MGAGAELVDGAVVVTGVVGAAVAGTVAGGGEVIDGEAADPNACTPPWPRQAPVRRAPDHVVPSLQDADSAS